jgi:hypothetical protein
MTLSKLALLRKWMLISGIFDIVKELIAKGTNINAKTNDSLSALVPCLDDFVLSQVPKCEGPGAPMASEWITKSHGHSTRRGKSQESSRYRGFLVNSRRQLKRSPAAVGNLWTRQLSNGCG